MYAVIEKTTRAVLRTCNTKEAALVACQLEKDKVGVAERGNITAVTMSRRLSVGERQGRRCGARQYYSRHDG